MTGPRWFVAVAQPGRERLAIEHLLRQDFGTLLPALTRRVLVRGRLEPREELAFPGYVFVAFDPAVDRWRSVNGTRGVVRLLGDGETPLPLPRPVADELVTRFGAGPVEDLASAVELFRPGTALRVLQGPFAAYVGRCLWASAERVRLRLEAAGRAIPLTLPADQVAVA